MMLSTQSNNVPLYNLTTNNWWVDDDEPVFPPDLSQLTVSRNMFVEFKVVDETTVDNVLAMKKSNNSTTTPAAFVSELVAKKKSRFTIHQPKPTIVGNVESAPDLVIEQENGMPVLSHADIFDDSPETMSRIMNHYSGARNCTPPTKTKDIIFMYDEDDEELSLVPRCILTPAMNQMALQVSANFREHQKRGTAKKSTGEKAKKAVTKRAKKSAKATVANCCRKVKGVMRVLVAAEDVDVSTGPILMATIETTPAHAFMDDDSKDYEFVRSMLVDDIDCP